MLSLVQNFSLSLSLISYKLYFANNKNTIKNSHFLIRFFCFFVKQIFIKYVFLGFLFLAMRRMGSTNYSNFPKRFIYEIGYYRYETTTHSHRFIFAPSFKKYLLLCLFSYLKLFKLEKKIMFKCLKRNTKSVI